MSRFKGIKIASIGLAILVSACSYRDYKPGSIFWYTSAPEEEIKALLAKETVPAICRKWTDFELYAGQSKARNRFQDAAGAELQNRGLSPMTCAPGAQQAVLQKQLREAQEAIEQAQRDAATARRNTPIYRSW